MKFPFATILLFAATAVFFAGCGGKNAKTTGISNDDDILGQPEIFRDDSGFPLVGDLPFDQDPSRHKVAEGMIGPVYFAYDSSFLPPSELAKIQSAASLLLENADFVLIVEGHCDERGSNEYNLSLGEQRALTIRSFILEQGISSDRVQTRSFGEERPAVSGSGESAWRQNRRGEFVFYK